MHLFIGLLSLIEQEVWVFAFGQAHEEENKAANAENI